MRKCCRAPSPFPLLQVFLLLLVVLSTRSAWSQDLLVFPNVHSDPMTGMHYSVVVVRGVGTRPLALDVESQLAGMAQEKVPEEYIRRNTFDAVRDRGIIEAMKAGGEESIFDGRSSFVVVLEHATPLPRDFTRSQVTVVGMIRASYVTKDKPLLPLELRLKRLGLLPKPLAELEDATGGVRVEVKNLFSSERLRFSLAPLLVAFLEKHLMTPEGFAAIPGCQGDKPGYLYLETQGPKPNGKPSFLQKIYAGWGFDLIPQLTLMNDPDLEGKSTAFMRLPGTGLAQVVPRMRDEFPRHLAEKVIREAKPADDATVKRLRNATMHCFFELL